MPRLMLCRNNRFAFVVLTGLLAAVGPFAGTALAGPLPKQTRTFQYTGEWAYFTVPAGVSSIGLDLRGGSGGRGGYDLEEGGDPKPQGRVTGSLPMAGSGDELIRVAVGGNGGVGTVCLQGRGGAGGGSAAGFVGGDGGGAGGCSGGGGGGGGASIVQVPTGYPDFVATRDSIVAAGGGGGYGGGAFPAPRAFEWWQVVTGGPWHQLHQSYLPLLSEAARGEYDDRFSGDGYTDGIAGTAGQGWGNTLDPSGVDFKGASWDGGGAGGGGGGIQGGQGGWVSDQHDVSAQPGKSGRNRAGDYRDLSAFLTASYEAASEGSVTITWNGPAAPALGTAPAARTRVPRASIELQGMDGASFTCKLDDQPAAPCSSPLVLSSLAVGDHVLAVTQSVAGVSSEPTTIRWTVEPPFLAPTVTGVAPTLAKRVGSWRVGLAESFTTGGDTRGPARLLTVQVSTSATRPSNSQPVPRSATYLNGVVAWAGEVSRRSIARPRWVRVGNRLGLWTGWVAIVVP